MFKFNQNINLAELALAEKISSFQRVETIDGTAEAGEDYNKIDEVVTMAKYDRFFPLDVTIIDDNQWEPDETFFVKLSLVNSNPDVKLGHKAICMITIIDDDGRLF